MFFELPEELQKLADEIRPYEEGCHLRSDAPPAIKAKYELYISKLNDLMYGVM